MDSPTCPARVYGSDDRWMCQPPLSYVGSVPGYDWSRIPTQPRWIQWLADHRVWVRVVLIVVDVLMVLLVIYGFSQGSWHWWNALQIVVWAGITAQFGWLLPHQVDKWREQETLAANTSARKRFGL